MVSHIGNPYRGQTKVASVGSLIMGMALQVVALTAFPAFGTYTRNCHGPASRFIRCGYISSPLTTGVQIMLNDRLYFFFTFLAVMIIANIVAVVVGTHVTQVIAWLASVLWTISIALFLHTFFPAPSVLSVGLFVALGLAVIGTVLLALGSVRLAQVRWGR